MLAGGDHFDAVDDFGRDNLDILVKALTEFDRDTFGTSVVVDEDITVVSADEFLNSLIGSDNRFRLTQADGGGDVHTRTEEVLAVWHDDLHLESVARGVYGRIDHFNGCREDFVGIDLRGEGEFHSGLEEREVTLRNSHERFEFV